MNDEANRIFSIYKIFYKKEPNLSIENKENIIIEIQAMAYILKYCECDIWIGEFDYNEEIGIKMPISTSLQNLIENEMISKSLHGIQTKHIIDNITLQKIIIIGEIICAKINESENPTELLRTIAITLFEENKITLGNSILENNSNEKIQKVVCLVNKLKFDKPNGF